MLVVALLSGTVAVIPASATTSKQWEQQSTAWAFEKVSVGPDGAAGNDNSWDPSISADGRTVAFQSSASNLLSGSTPDGDNLFVRDLGAGTNEIANVASDGSRLMAGGQPGLNGDGSVVAFAAISGDGYGLFRRARAGAATAMVSPPALHQSMSADGDRVAYYVYDATSDDDYRTYVNVFDATPADGAPNPRRITDFTDLNQGASYPSISADGRFVAYVATSGIMSSRQQTELRVQNVGDLAADSLPPFEVLASNVDQPPEVSADGRFVVYVDKEDQQPHIFDRQTGSATIASVPGSAHKVQISGDGQTVAVALWAEVDGKIQDQLWVADLPTGSAEFLSAIDRSYGSSVDISADGSAVVFSCRKTQVADVFVARRDTPRPVWPADAALRVEEAGHTFVALSWDPATDDKGVVAYEIQRDGAPAGETAGDVTSTTINGLDPGTEYRFAVTARDGDGFRAAGPTVTARTPSDSGGIAALSAQAHPGGLISLTWDPVPGGGHDGYRIMRATQGAAMQQIADVPADVTSYEDAGRDAETAYRYEVRVLRGGAEEAYSRSAEATTPALSLTGADWSGATDLGGEVTITLIGEGNRRGSADIQYRTWFAEDGSKLDAPRDASTTLDAAEVSAGTYRAVFPLVEGVSEVRAIHAGIADAAGHAAARDLGRLPRTVRGALAVDINAPAGSIPNGRLLAASRDCRYAQLPISGGGTYRMLLAPANCRLMVLSGRGTTLGQVEFSAYAGLSSALTVVPGLLASLSAKVRDDRGEPFPDLTVAFTDLDTGRFLDSERTNRDGDASLTRELIAGQHIEVKIESFAGVRPMVAPAPVDVELSAGENSVVLAFTPTPRGVLAGQVTSASGAPISGVRVAATERVGGRDWTFSGDTGDDGRYSIGVLAGTVDATFSDGFSTPSRVAGLEVAPDETVTRDVQMPHPRGYQLTINLHTREGDDPWQGPLPIDSRVAIHFRIQGVLDDVPFGIGSSRMLIDGRQGQRVEVCADGVEAGMTEACDSAVLGDVSGMALDLRLSSAGRVVGSLVNSDGQPLSLDFYGHVNLLDASGRWVNWTTVRQGRFDFQVPKPGDYTFQARTWWGGRVDSQNKFYDRAIPITVEQGQTVDLGRVPIGDDDTWPRGSSITLSRRWVVPRGVVDVRAVVRSDMVGPVHDAVLLVDVPSGGEVVAGSVTVDRTPVAGELAGGRYTIPLGERDSVTGWVVGYQMRIGDADGGSVLPLDVRLQYARGQSHLSPAFYVGSATIGVVGVSLEAPPASAVRSVTVSGMAPPGSVVGVMDEFVFLGETTARPSGLWSLPILLPDHGDGYQHRLQAHATIDGQDVASTERWLRFDSRYPVLERVTIGQHDGRVVGIDPEQGVARFPYVVVPTWGVNVGMRFGGRGSVTAARARMGATQVNAFEQPDGSFSAGIPAGPVGPISVAYDSEPAPVRADSPKPSEAEVRSQLPIALRDFTDLATAYGEDPSGTKTGTASARLPSLGQDARMRVTLSVTRNVSYQPTAGDLATARRTGIPFYGFQSSVTPQEGGLSASVSGYVPESFLDNAGSSARKGVHGNGAEGILHIGLDFALEGAHTAEDLHVAMSVGGKYATLNRLLDTAAGCGLLAPVFTARVNGLARKALAADAAHAALIVAGLVLVPTTLGLGTLAVWGLTYAADHAVDYALEEAMSEAEADMSASPSCEKDPRVPDPDRRVADPVWIYDPSGYAYEAVESNRVEGVTTTLLSGGDGASPGAWDFWDGAWFGQENPLTTDANGHYGWDVPVGWWKVAFTADGYEPASSDALQVMPPHFDVNVGMVSLAAPTVSGIRAVSGPSSAVEVTFDKYMKLSVVDDSLIHVAHSGGGDVAGTLEAVGAEASPAGVTLARVFRFVPSSPFATGDELGVTVDAPAMSYADRPMLDTVTQTVAAGDGIAPQATLSHSGALTAPLTATFDEAVNGVTDGNLVLRVAGSASAIPGSLSCRNAGSAEVACATGAVREATLTPSSPLVPGQGYSAVLNPEATPPILDLAGNPMAQASQSFRASVSEQETSPAAFYAWRQVASRAATGGSYTTDHRPGAQASFSFTGTGVSWRTLVGPDQGRAKILIDGRRRATIDNYSAKQGFAMRPFKGLGGGDHQITIVVAGKNARSRDSLVGVDAFRVGRRTVATPSLRYKWQQVSASRASGGRYTQSDLAGSAVSFVFRGTSITWIARTGADQGQAKIFIDGRLRSVGGSAIIDNYAARPGFVGRRIRGLTDRVHTIRIVVLGTKRTAARGKAIGVDRFAIG